MGVDRAVVEFGGPITDGVVLGGERLVATVQERPFKCHWEERKCHIFPTSVYKRKLRESSKMLDTGPDCRRSCSLEQQVEWRGEI